MHVRTCMPLALATEGTLLYCQLGRQLCTIHGVCLNRVHRHVHSTTCHGCAVHMFSTMYACNCMCSARVRAHTHTHNYTLSEAFTCLYMARVPKSDSRMVCKCLVKNIISKYRKAATALLIVSIVSVTDAFSSGKQNSVALHPPDWASVLG